MTHNLFLKNIKKHNLKEENPIDHIYDPDRHHVINNYEDKNKVKKIFLNLFFSKKTNVVGKVHSVGYVYNDKSVLRKAKVDVVRNVVKTNANNKSDENNKNDKENNQSEDKKGDENNNNEEKKA